MRSAAWAAIKKGLQAGWENLSAILALETVMALLVASYYFWPTASAALSRFAIWQQSGGILMAALASALAGGVLSEVTLVYFQEGGRWSKGRLENTGFKFVLFFISGAIVYEFYRMQAVWFGNGTAWRVLASKIIVDQLGYTVFWSVPFQVVVTRWHALRFSVSRLRGEMKHDFIRERMLPVLVTNWMLWFPGVTFVYCMPQNLQMPLAIFGNAIWSLLLSTTAGVQYRQTTGTARDLVEPQALPQVD